MFERMIRAAYEAGGELKVFLRQIPGTSFVGRVQDVDEKGFLLFHHGRSQGNLWAFRFEDVSTCALMTRLPSDGPPPLGLHAPAPLGEG